MVFLWWAESGTKNAGTVVLLKNSKIIYYLKFHCHILEDACGMPLAYNCAEISDRIFCNECQLATYGPREIGFFMSKWTKDTNVRSLKSEV